MKTIRITKFIAAALSIFALSAFAAAAPVFIDAKQIGDFKQGSIKGLPGVLPLNELSIAVLADAPDSSLDAITGKIFDQYRQSITNGGQMFNGVQASTLASVFPPLESLKSALAQSLQDSRRPLWAQSTQYERIPVMTDGRLVYEPTQTRLARNAFNRTAYRAVQSDMRAANEYALILNTFKNTTILPGGKEAAAGSLLMFWNETSGTFSKVYPTPTLGDNAQVARCSKLPMESLEQGDKITSVRIGSVGKGDADVVCIAFKNLVGVRIPTEIQLRDMSQFKPTDDLKVAVVFTKLPSSILSVPGVAGFRASFESSIVDAKASYLQIIDAKTMQALGPHIPLDSPDLLRYASKDCVDAMGRQQGAVPALASMKCAGPTN